MPSHRAALVFALVPALAIGCSSAQTPKSQSPKAQPHATHPAATSSSSADAHTWQLERKSLTVLVPDPQFGFMPDHTTTIPEVSLLVPKGWTVQAGMPNQGPNTDCAEHFGRIGIQVSSPDHSINLVSLPGQATLWSNNRALLQQRAMESQRWRETAACTITEPKTLQEGLPLAARMIYKDGSLAGPIEPVPGLSAELPQSVAQANQTLAAHGARLQAEAGQVRIDGTNTAGQAMESRLIILQVTRTDPIPGGGTVQLTDTPLLAFESAPKGQLAASQHLLDAVLNSIQIAPEYSAYTTQYALGLARIRRQTEDRLSQIYSQMAQDNANAAAQQASIRRDANNYSSNVINNVSRNRAAALDHSSQQFALSMNDQALYHDGSGHTVQLPNQYGHVWASSTGNTNDYVLTDSSSYNPNGQLGSSSWTELQPVR